MSRTIQLHTGNQSLITLVASASTAITASYALSAPGGGLSGGTTNYIPLWTGTSTISSSNLYQNTSNVGIGTTTPATILDVNGGISIGAGKVISASANYTQLFRRDGNVGIYLGGGDPANYYDNTSHYFRDVSGVTTRMIINSAGNVGIGATSPAYKLDVIGNARIGQNSTSSTAARLDITAGGSGFNSFIDFGFYNTFDAGVWYMGRRGGTEAFFIDNASTGTEVNVVTINNSNNNVGIGTTNPQYKLAIASASANGLEIDPANASGTQTAILSYNRATSAYTPLVIQGSTVAIGPASFPVTINSAGSVGIGTAAPQYKLHVSGGLSLFNSSTAGSDGNSGIRIVSPIATTHYNWMVAAQQNVGAAFEITPSTAVGGTTFSSPTAVFTATGRVGINTTNVPTKLTVNTVPTDASIYVYDTDASVLTHQTPTATATLNDPKEVLVLARQGTSGQAYAAAASLQLSRYVNTGVDSRTRLDFVLANTTYLAGPTTVMTMRSDGNVGIGTTSPSSTLHIQGNVSASSYTSSISNGVGYFGTASYAVSASYAPAASTQVSAESDQVILCVQIFS